MKSTEIAWTDSTFNPWWGCARVSPGCERCYAETFAKRVGQKIWGVTAGRRFFGDKHWKEPLRWNRDAEKAGVRRRVFCASMADVFEARLDLAIERAKLWALIEDTPHLDWQLLTKRPENIRRMVPTWWLDSPPPNVWYGTTAEDQERAEQRIPELLRVPAAVRFVSCEPLLGPMDLRRWLTLDIGGEKFGSRGNLPSLDWSIVGGESGRGARLMDLTWARSIVEQCRAAGIACFMKQLGANVRFNGVSKPGQHWPPGTDMHDDGRGGWRVHLRDRKGGDISEFPPDLRVREFPR